MKQNESKHIFSIIGFSITILLLSLPSYSKELPKIGKDNKAKTSKPGMASLAKPKPDFGIVSIKKAHSTGPKSIFRYGGCDNELKVVARNSGDIYEPGLFYDFRNGIRQKGSLVRVHHLESNQFRSKPNANDYFFFTTEINNSRGKWPKGLNLTKSTHVSFQMPGVHQIKTTIQACSHGDGGYGACLGLAEKNQQDNTKTFKVEVKEPCPLHKSRG